MSIVRLYVRGVTALNRWLAYSVAGLVYVMVAVILYEVVSRSAFNAPTVWAMESATLLFGPYFLLAGPWLLHTKGHVAVDFVRMRLPPRAGLVLECLTYPVIFIFAAILIAYGWPFAVNAYALGETSFSAWNPIIWPFKFAIPLAAILLLAQAVAEFLRMICTLAGHEGIAE